MSHQNPDVMSHSARLKEFETLFECATAWMDHSDFKNTASINEYENLVAYHKSFEHVIDKCIDYKKLKSNEKAGDNFEKCPDCLGLREARAQELVRLLETRMEKDPKTNPTKELECSHSSEELVSKKEPHMEKHPKTNLTKQIEAWICEARAQKLVCLWETRMEKDPKTNPTEKEEYSHSSGLRKDRAQELVSLKEKHMEKDPKTNLTNKVESWLCKVRAQECKSLKMMHMEKDPKTVPTNEEEDASFRKARAQKQAKEDLYLMRKHFKKAPKPTTKDIENFVRNRAHGQELVRKGWTVSDAENLENVSLTLCKARAELLEEKSKFPVTSAVCKAHAEVCESLKHLKKDPNSFLTKIVEYAEQLAKSKARDNALEKAEVRVIKLSMHKVFSLALRKGREVDALALVVNLSRCIALEKAWKAKEKERKRFAARCNALRKEIKPEEENVATCSPTPEWDWVLSTVACTNNLCS